MKGKESIKIESIMRKEVYRIGLDATLGEAMTLCLQHRIRHLPVVDSDESLVGLVTDRDLRAHISHRLGTIMENNADRETLHRRVHMVMVRGLVTVTRETAVGEAAHLMLQHHIGCLPVVDDGNHLVGMVTTSDLLNLLAEEHTSQETGP